MLTPPDKTEGGGSAEAGGGTESGGSTVANVWEGEFTDLAQLELQRVDCWLIRAGQSHNGTTARAIRACDGVAVAGIADHERRVIPAHLLFGDDVANQLAVVVLRQIREFAFPPIRRVGSVERLAYPTVWVQLEAGRDVHRTEESVH
mgnify:CR=1 FL=1